MENILYRYNINMSNRGQLYRQAQKLATELGYDLTTLRERWRQSTSNYWRNEIQNYQRNIRNRDRRYNLALRISRENREPLQRIANTSGTDYAYWNREVRRLQMRVRRNPIAVQNIQQIRNRVAPILQQVRQPDNLQRQRQQRRMRIIKTELKEKEKRKRLNRNIRNKQFQKVFNMVKDENITLTNNQAENVFNSIMSDGKFNIKLIINGVVKYIAFNDTTRDFIINVLTNGYIVEEREVFGSDTINNMKIREIEDIKIERVIHGGRIIKNRDGKFFAYINTTNLDLAKYQIYNQEQVYNLEKREHCLIHTLLESGINKALVNEIKLTFKKGCSFKKSDIKKVSEIIDKTIILNNLKPNGTIKKTTYNKGKDIINIALHENHYFIYEDTIYSKYFIDNYEKCKEFENPYNIVKLQKEKYPRYDEGRKINSLLMVEKLLKAGYFKKLDMVKFEESSSHIKLREHIYLDNIENEQEECDLGDANEVEDKDEKPKEIYYADCESFVRGENHELYLLGCANNKNDYVSIYNVCDKVHKDKDISPEQNLIYEWLKSITRCGKQNAIVYFHNLKYDYHLLEPYINIKDKCEKDNSLYSVKLTYRKCEIELRDSYKLLPFSLSKFSSEFDLNEKFRKKEAIGYTYYTKENNHKIIKTDEYKKYLSNSEIEIFNKNIKNEESYDKFDKTFNPTTYYIDYLKLDCLVLKKGIQKFNNIIQEITNNKMCVYECLTISSLTDKYMIKMGAYEGVYKVKANLRAYIAKAVYGGRVCVNKKYKKKIIEGKISDYDGVSLYPSAINRLCREMGLPKGKALRYTKNDLKNWDNKLYSILTIKINKVNKIQQMPFIANKNEDGILEYTNEALKNEIVIDSITLNDYINFHKIEFEVLDGVYWNNGGNKVMGEVIQNLFNARLKAKKENKTALSNTIKLMLNSAYGKTIMKKSNTETKIIKTLEKKYNPKTKEWEEKNKICNFHNYIYNNFNTIKTWRPMNKTCIEVEKICSDDSYNRGHIGCAILSMSKRIMNEVFDVANDNNYPIYYTDTDSLHCNLEDVSKLEEKYKERFNKELNGKNLEQFHTDFNLDGACSEIYATKSIFLGKKSYIDLLESKDKDGNIIKGHHIRLKGITEEGLKHTSKKYVNGYEGLYTDLARGEKIEIFLNPLDEDDNKQKVIFEYENGKVRTKKLFSRKVKF
jgi:hypothetical protein